MQDYLVRGTAMDGKIRVFAVRSTALVEELRRRHDTWPTATAALGRTATAGAMMGAMLKDRETVTIQIKGNGPIGLIVVDANAVGEVRGYVDRPHVHLPSNAQGKLDVAGAVGKEGFLYIIKDLGLKEPYRGSVPIVSGEIAEDFTYYFAHSEQIPSAVALGVLVDTDNAVIAAGGFIIQLLPGVSDEEITNIEQHLAQLQSVSELLYKGYTPEQILESILPSVLIHEKMEIRFQCQCSHERVERTLISLGKAEIENMLKDNEHAELVCHFCNEKYVYEKHQLAELLKKM